jgi:hypothetical protein
MKNSPLHSNWPGQTSHLLSLAIQQWLCPCPVSLSLAATATAATVSQKPSPAAPLPRPACRAPGPRDAAAAPCAGASRHHPMQALPGNEEGGAAPRRHPPTRTRPDWEMGPQPAAHSAGAAEQLCSPACHAPPPRAAAGARDRCPLQALPDGEGGGGRISRSTVPEPPPAAAAAALSGAAATLHLSGVVVIGNEVLPPSGSWSIG